MKNYELNKRKAKKEYATEVYKQAVSDKDVELQYKMNNRHSKYFNLLGLWEFQINRKMMLLKC